MGIYNNTHCLWQDNADDLFWTTITFDVNMEKVQNVDANCNTICRSIAVWEIIIIFKYVRKQVKFSLWQRKASEISVFSSTEMFFST